MAEEADDDERDLSNQAIGIVEREDGRAGDRRADDCAGGQHGRPEGASQRVWLRRWRTAGRSTVPAWKPSGKRSGRVVAPFASSSALSDAPISPPPDTVER